MIYIAGYYPVLTISIMTDYLYLHGFNSSAQSLKAQETADWLLQNDADSRFHCPTLSVHPSSALQQAYDLLANFPKETVLIGSSLGGFYAAWLAQTLNRKAVLINPAIEPHLDLARLPREQTNPYTGERYQLNDDDMKTLQSHRVLQPDPARFWVVLGSADEVLDWRHTMRHFQGCRQTLFNGDDHRLQRWPECLPFLAAFAKPTQQ